MRVRAITPILVDEAELRRRQERYDRLAPAGWEVQLENLEDSADSPRQLGSDEHIRQSESMILRAIQSGKAQNVDLVLPDCVLDPAVTEAGANVIGLTRLTAHFLAAFGLRFGVITRNSAIGEEYRAVVERYGLGALFDDVYVLDLSVEDIADDRLWNAAVEVVAQRAAAAGTRILINGCSAVEVAAHGGAVRIIDPTRLAFAVAQLGAAEGLLGEAGAS